MLIHMVLVFLLASAIYCKENINFFRNDYIHEPTVNYWFKFNPVPMTWHDARLHCSYEGAVIASPVDGQFSLILEKFISDNRVKEAYIGVHSTFSKASNEWQSVEGVPIAKMNLEFETIFARSSNAQCAILMGEKLYSVNCSEKYPFVCYKDGNTVPTMTDCGTVDKEYKLDKTGSCYKYHLISKSWTRAYEICVAEGGYLAIIDNNFEANIILQMLNDNLKNAINSHNVEMTHIGFIDWKLDREWYTVHGEPLHTKGYSQWKEGEPNNNDKDEYCGSVAGNSKLNDVPCDGFLLPFICEKDPGSLRRS